MLLIPSANDAATVLACYMSETVGNFAEKMNQKATEIGCKNTHFVNPNGVHNDDHYSTAYDMALIGKYATQFDTITQIALTSSYSLPPLPNGTKRTFKTTNTLITEKNQYFYEYATGLKTGYTDKAKSCIVATAKKDDINLICVVLGGDKTAEKKAERELDCKTLFEYGFNNFKHVDLCLQDSSVDTTKISNVPDYLKNCNLTYANSLNVLAPINGATTSTINFEPDKTLPVMKNTVVGKITYTVDNKDYTVNILNSDDILPPETVSSTQNIYYLLVALLVLVLFVAIRKKKRRKRSKLKYYRHSFY